MSLTTLPHRRTGLIALGLVTGLALSSLVSAGPASAFKPTDSRAEVMLETPGFSGDPSNAITAGWWGHEGGAGPAGVGATFLSINADDGAGGVDIAPVLAAMGTDDTSKISFAIVPFSPDGHNERPTVTDGESVTDAFPGGWYFDKTLGSGLNGGNLANDSVLTVSTKAQFAAYVAAGRPVQAYDDMLVLHDATAPGNPVSTAPKGTSILDTWDAGTQLSLVAFVNAGEDPLYDNQLPLVATGPDGKAKTAWLPFTTVASPTSPLRTSAGYKVAGPAKPGVTVSAGGFTGNDATLTATVKKADSSVATDATGHVEFSEVIGGTPQAPTSINTSNGVATLPVTVTPGASKVYSVKYVPDAAAQLTYLTSDAVNKTVAHEAAPNPTATTTTLTASGIDTYTLKAGVAPSAAGSVTFTDGATALGQAAVSGGSARVTASLTPGQHTLKAAFSPSSSAAFSASSSTSNVWVPEVTTSLKPTKAVAGKKGKLKITLGTPGTTASGRLTVTIKPPKGGKAKTITVSLAGGHGTVKLGKLVKGKTKLTIEYAGNGPVLGVTTTATVKSVKAK